MPELPEVETVRRGLLERAIGGRIVTVEALNHLVIQGSRERFTSSICGRKIVSASRKGKVLAIELRLRTENAAASRYLVIRLGMTGQFVVAPRDAPLRPHTHMRLTLDDGHSELRFRDTRRFGCLRCCTRQELEEIFASLGPDAQEITEQQFRQAMRGRSGAIKNWLMNQQILSGLGNIYADETLFEARIHPLAQPGRVSTPVARRLYLAMRKVLARAVALQGTTFRDYIDIEGRPGRYRLRLCVYQRTGEPCFRCGHKIRRLVIAGRSSHFCPRCQRRPRYFAKPGS